VSTFSVAAQAAFNQCRRTFTDIERLFVERINLLEQQIEQHTELRLQQMEQRILHQMTLQQTALLAYHTVVAEADVMVVEVADNDYDDPNGADVAAIEELQPPAQVEPPRQMIAEVLRPIGRVPAFPSSLPKKMTDMVGLW
jgi:hypothetical protein